VLRPSSSTRLLRLLLAWLFQLQPSSSSWLVLWLQQRKKLWLQKGKHVQCLQTILCVSLQKMQVIWYKIAKKARTVCVCNYFACVIATRNYLWLHHGWSLCGWSCLVIWLFMIASLTNV
jgi:hypothetical protein